MSRSPIAEALPDGWTLHRRTESVRVLPGEPGYSDQYQAFRPGVTVGWVERDDGAAVPLTAEEVDDLHHEGAAAVPAIVVRARSYQP